MHIVTNMIIYDILKKNSLQPVVYHGEPVVYFLPPYQLNTLNIIVQLFASLILYAKNIIELLLPMPKTTFKIILTLFNMQNNMERHCNAGPWFGLLCPCKGDKATTNYVFNNGPLCPCHGDRANSWGKSPHACMFPTCLNNVHLPPVSQFKSVHCHIDMYTN